MREAILRRLKRLENLVAGLGSGGAKNAVWIQTSGSVVNLARAPEVFYLMGNDIGQLNLNADVPPVDGDEVSLSAQGLDTPWILQPSAGVFIENPAIPPGGSSANLTFASAIRARWKFEQACVRIGGAPLWVCLSSG